MSDPRRAALESLFVVREEDAGRMAALTLPSIPSGGWAEREDGGERQSPYGAKARVLALRDAVVTEALRLIDAAAPEPGAVLAGIVRAEEHERAALVRERDEALAAAEVARRQREDAEREAADLRKALALIRDAPGKVERLTERVALLEATIADYEREARARSPEGRRREQLALFAPPAADPAGEAQRAASSGAAVAALAAAMPDAPAPKPAKVPAPVCAPCGGVPLVPAADMPREGEATGGKPLGCPACGEGYDGTPEQIARAQADSDAATKRIAKAEGKCWRCGHGIHRGRCNGSFR